MHFSPHPNRDVGGGGKRGSKSSRREERSDEPARESKEEILSLPLSLFSL